MPFYDDKKGGGDEEEHLKTQEAVHSVRLVEKRRQGKQRQPRRQRGKVVCGHLYSN